MRSVLEVVVDNSWGRGKRLAVLTLSVCRQKMSQKPFMSLFLACLAASVPESGAQPLSVFHAPLIPHMIVWQIRPTALYPRNTEGAFLALRDGRILFAYSRFTGGGQDNDAAEIAARITADDGQTWSPDFLLLPRGDAMNVMSVSLLRCQDGRIALFYVRKNSPSDSRPYVTYSSDEARTWSQARPCISRPGYYVLNNDRVIRLASGRLVMPVALHSAPSGGFTERGRAMAYLSDDDGRQWHRSRNELQGPANSRAGLQEPGVVELRGGTLLMWMRTLMGVQYVSTSHDGGDSWSPARPSGIVSPLSPASIKRIPSTGDLLLVWNDHSRVDASLRAVEDRNHVSGGRRTPLTAAISRDEGKSWILRHDIEDDRDGWYCYTAIYFQHGRVLLGFASGGHGLPLLSKLDLVSFPLADLYQDGRSR
jgi:sialidase-1